MPWMPCFVTTISLVITESIRGQHPVSDLIAIERRIVVLFSSLLILDYLIQK